MKKLLIVRHGKTVWNQQHKLQGSGSDSPLLTTDFMTDYADLAAYLRPFKINAVYSSPIGRALKTAEILLEKFQVAAVKRITPLPELAEISFGDWEGWSKEQLIENYPVAFKSLSLRQNDPVLQAIGVEDFIQARQRFKQGIKKIIDQSSTNQTILIVSHGAISQLGIKQVTGNENLGGLANLAVSVIAYQEPHFILETYNETAFLQHPLTQQENTSIL